MPVEILRINVNLRAFLENFKDHRRLSVFYYKGFLCVNCHRMGTNIRFRYDKKEVKDLTRTGVHVDLFCGDILMTVDHIVPRSLGGSDELWNKQPMCAPCNTKKANKMSEQDKLIALANMLSFAHLKTPNI